jgi:DmsE family decaheme c-type cytochrome
MKNEGRRRFASSNQLRSGSSGQRITSRRLRTAVIGALLCLPVLGVTSAAWGQPALRFEDMRATLNLPAAPSSETDPVAALADYVSTSAAAAQSPHGVATDGAASQPMHGFAQPRDTERPQLISANESEPHALGADGAFAALAEFAAHLEGREPSFKFAETKAKAKTVKAPAKIAADDEATFVGSQVCLGCHTSQAAAFNQTVMGRIFRNPRTPQEKGGCETCHGAGSSHVKAGGGRGVGGIISFRKNDTSRPVAENNAICLSCHDKGDRSYWQGSVHESRDVACTDCHTVMARVSVKGQLKTEREVETCFQCHKDRRMQSQRTSHMPLREGKMTCTNCHNPHGSASDAMLKQASVNDNCYSCHAEKRGPFLWEHPPVRENCLNCHEAHGSNHESLLKVQRPRLCQDCHSIGHPSQSPLVNTAFNRSCNNCHSQIHGSNHPSGPLFQR